MNPNGQQQNLDPKLKEAYDRVMGTQIHPTPASPTAQPLNTPAAAAPHPQKVEHQAPAQSGPQPIINISSVQSPGKAPQAAKGKGGISSVLFIVLGLLFFAGYTVVWLKVFKIL